MTDPLSGVFSAFTDDETKVNPNLEVDRTTIAGEDPSDPFLRSELYSAGGAFFRSVADRRSHGLDKLQLAVSDPQERHGPCYQLLVLETEEEVAAFQGIAEVQETTLTWRGQEKTIKFVKVPLPTREELLDELSEKSPTKLEQQCIALGVTSDQLVERLPYQGRGGQILASAGYKYTGTQFDNLSPSEVDALFELFEYHHLYGRHNAKVKHIAASAGMSISKAHEILERIRAANIFRAELLELGSGEVVSKDEEEEAQPRFPRPKEYELPDSFRAFSDYATFVRWTKETPDFVPSLDEVKSVLPKSVVKKLKWPKATMSLQETWKVISAAFAALQKWEDARLEAWAERCQDGWTTLGALASTVSGGFFDVGDEENLGEVDDPLTYFQSDEPEVRPRQGLLSQPPAETDEELTVGDLRLRMRASVTTPRDRQIFMGDAGPLASELPYVETNESDAPGMPVKHRGHPLAFSLGKVVELAASPRDPVAIELIEAPFEVRRVTIAELLYGRHKGFRAAEGLRQEIETLTKKARLIEDLLPHINAADVEDFFSDLTRTVEDLAVCEGLLPEQEELEAQWKADIEAGVKSLNQVVPKRRRLVDGRFANFDAYLVNPIWGWDLKTKEVTLTGGEYWVPMEPIPEDVNQLRHRICVHVYPVQQETGHIVSLWYIRDGKAVIRKEAKDDPLLVKYGPNGENPQKKVFFRSLFEAEAERFGLRKTPVLTKDYTIKWQLVRDVFPDACRFVSALCDSWHEGVEDLTEVDDELAAVDQWGEPIRTRVRFARKEGLPDDVEIHTQREDLLLAMWEELRRFQDEALDLAIEVNRKHHLSGVIAEMTEAYYRISNNPQWGWAKNQDSGWSFNDRVLKAGGTLDRALTRVRERPILPRLEKGGIPTAVTFWKAFGYLGCERPTSFVGTLVADRLYHANPGLAGWRMTDDGRRWQRAGVFEAWRFSEGPLGRLKSALYAVMFPKPGLEEFIPPLDLVRREGIEEATLTHLRWQVKEFLGRFDEQVVQKLRGLLGIPCYTEAEKLALVFQVSELLNGDAQPQSEREQLIRQLWIEQPELRGEILESLLTKDGRRIYGARLWPMLRDLGGLRLGGVNPPPPSAQTSFCEPYVRKPAERV